MMSPRLSKSRYLYGQQCDLRLWYECYHRDLASPPDPASQARFDAGHVVGDLARERFPGGVLVEADHRHGDEAQRDTAVLVADPAVPAVYEGGFEHQGVRVRVDVLVRAPAGGFDLVEVKSTTRVKALHDLDAALQAWVLRGAGVDLRRCGVLTLDRDYAWPGGAFDLEALFRLHDRTDLVQALLPGIGPEVVRLHALLAADHAPDIAPGPQCSSPYPCPFFGHCTRDLPEGPEWPLRTLPALGARRRRELEALGIEDVREVPADFPLSPLQAVVREAARSGSDVVHGDLAGALSALRHPVHHLDFETVAPPIPRYPGTRPYDAIAFQFSAHTEPAAGELSHTGYLHPDGSDPREPLVRALLEALGEAGSIVVYSGFEAQVIAGLATALPGYRARLQALLPRLWDLHAVVRGCYYHPAFGGSFSIKSVLPALVPELAYDDLEIGDGGLAAVSYLLALDTGDGAGRERIFEALRVYCARDTLGLVRIRAWLAARLEA